MIALPQDLTIEAFLRRADAPRRARAILDADCQLWPSFKARACRIEAAQQNLERTLGSERKRQP